MGNKSHREFSYLQILDTVNFNPKLNGNNPLNHLVDEGFINFALYSVFYDVVLSPNQIFDLPLIRDERFDLSKIGSFPFILTIDSRNKNKEHKFKSQLIQFLRRSDSETFVFGSLPNGSDIAENWNSFLKEVGENLSDSDLILEARKYYNDIVDWAERLDGNSNNLWVGEYNPICSFDKAYEFVVKDKLLKDKLPQSRSIIYRELSANDYPQNKAASLKADADFASNFQNASNITVDKNNIRLVISPNSLISPPTELSTSLTLDFAGLLKKIPEFEDCIKNASLSKIVKAREMAKDEILMGWKYLNEENAKNSRKFFKSGLRTFFDLLDMSKNHLKDLSLSFEQDPLTGKFKPSLNLRPLYNFVADSYLKFQLKSIDKFINIK